MNTDDRIARLAATATMVPGVILSVCAGCGAETEIDERWQDDFPNLHFPIAAFGRGLFVVSVQRSSLDLLLS